MASGTSSASRTRSSRATWSCAVSPSAIISSGDGACTVRASQTERTALPRRAMSSENEVSSDSACSTRSTRGATKVPEPRRCTSWPGADQRLHRLAHGDPAEAGQLRHLALGRQALPRRQRARLDAAAIRRLSCR